MAKRHELSMIAGTGTPNLNIVPAGTGDSVTSASEARFHA
ncbi:hypothetical protein FB461_1637 [Rarobacter faecitabidus]|uniref:Uncharacterized protein n=1 Tax=Rarobacter faecitabidus TaxID=13243 RepID=A0A542ZXL2_RARFA|nr:hypothetical protein FB461_1637 [Rarobacter faecitabidus]